MHSDLRPLEFGAIRRMLEGFARTPYGADAARNLEPAPDREVAARMQAAVTAAREEIDAGEAPVIDQLPDVRVALRQAAGTGATLSATALANVRRVLRAAEALGPAVAARPALYPEDPACLRPPPAVLEALDRAIDDGGRLRGDASPELERLTGECATLRETAESHVRERQRRRDLEGKMRYPERVAWHNDRAVLVMHAAHADRIKGVRRGTASAGRKVLIEPMEAVQANNRVEKLVGEISAEQQRVLREVTARLGAEIDALEGAVTALTWIDFALAAAQVSVAMNGHPPALVAERRVELNEAYHPLLLAQFADGRLERPVPLSMRLDPARRIVVLSGPNTGGKTVALKTLGLLVTMAYCGLHIPAESDCVIGDYRRVMVDVGDHQSLYHHLSTFAGHVEVLKRILGEADERTLVLLDELGTGTDPEEGAALAMAVLDELIERGVQGIINTHLSPLKDYAATRPEIVSASMAFDHQRLQPTYRLRLGRPGVSLGLTIAASSGMPERLVERARRHLETIADAR